MAERVIVSVPYEHKWAERLHPFTPPEESLKIYGHDNFEAMAKEGNPACKDFHTEDNYYHLHHHRFYTPETIMADVMAAAPECETMSCLVKNNGMWCICVVMYE